MTDQQNSRPADYLAAERTFLAWIRTGLALMGFGFVVARFGLFFRAMQTESSNLQVRSSGLSFWFGAALIVLGITVNLVSARRHIRLVRELNRGGTEYSRPSSIGIALAIALAALGIGITIYLVSVGEPRQDGLSKRQENLVNTDSGAGILTIPSRQSVDGTAEKLEKILQAKGIKLFALIDHSGEAKRAGMQMRPTKLLIFGNPKAGTPLMIATPSIAIDLPIKILIWEDGEGKVWISYNDPSYLQARHGLPAELVPNIAVVKALAEKAGE
jgi:uncharacterized protein (DUF302 family)/uncharacterized membrane protein YidH (DUF202 family)